MSVPFSELGRKPHASETAEKGRNYPSVCPVIADKGSATTTPQHELNRPAASADQKGNSPAKPTT
jgi:hypothetical protein